MTNEANPNDIEPVIESYTLMEMGDKLEAAAEGDEAYYCVDAIRDPRTKHKLIDPRSVLNAAIVRRMYESWSLDRDSVIRVTRNLEALDNQDESGMTIPGFAAQLHHYMMKIFTRDKTSYKPEVIGIVTSAVDMLDKVFTHEAISEIRISPDDLRPFTSYYDHLVNVAVYWLASFAALNRKYEQSPGRLEVWRSRDKNEMRRVAGGLYGELPKNVMAYYDIYARDSGTDEINRKKKGDLSLVTSGFFGALFHDLGLLEEPSILVSEEGKISDSLAAHPDASNALLKKKLGILYDERPLTRSIIKTHHERLDGGGYPQKSKNPHIFAQLLAVCDTYDELTTKQPRGKVLRTLARSAGKWYDGDVIRAFLSILQPYRLGERFDVFEEESSVPVMSCEITGVDNRYKPLIKITATHTSQYAGRAGETIDLADEANAALFV